MRYIIFSLLGVSLLTACTPETYIDTVFPDPSEMSATPDVISPLNTWTPGETVGPSADLYMNEVYTWQGCHGKANIIFASDNTLRWINDGQVLELPYFITNDSRLLFGCDYDCGNAVLNYRFDQATKDWKATGLDCDYTAHHNKGERAGRSL